MDTLARPTLPRIAAWLTAAAAVPVLAIWLYTRERTLFLAMAALVGSVALHIAVAAPRPWLERRNGWLFVLAVLAFATFAWVMLPLFSATAEALSRPVSCAFGGGCSSGPSTLETVLAIAVLTLMAVAVGISFLAAVGRVGPLLPSP